MNPIAIGGVMPAEEASGAPPGGSVYDLWSRDWPHVAAFGCARSALAAVLDQRKVPRVWLPAYACTALTDGAFGSKAEVRFYGTSRRLEPDLAGLEAELRAGDAVVGVDYFGRVLDLGGLPQRFANVLWIEDRAQALDTGVPTWGEVILYSPRKLVGVGDGGLLFGREPLPQPLDSAPADVWAPEDARALDAGGFDPPTWRSLFQAREAAFRVDGAAASDRTIEALQRLDVAPIRRARRANWQTLAATLPGFGLWPIAEPAFVPLAFPIVVDDAAGTVQALASQRIWAPRHWAELPTAAAAFDDAVWLSAHCVSLPLDQRYSRADMLRVADTVRLARPVA